MTTSVTMKVFSTTLLVLFATANISNAAAKTSVDNLSVENKKTLATHEHAQVKKASTLARAMAQSPTEAAQKSMNIEKTLTLDISELKDSSGLIYLGGKVSEVELSRYLSQLKSELGEAQYGIYRQHQAARDHQSFHVTLVNPYEYQTINKEKLKKSQKFRVTLHGLGQAKKAEKASYFVVASSSDGQFIRQSLLLKNKDFHVTLGFFPDDVFGVSKGRDTLITK